MATLSLALLITCAVLLLPTIFYLLTLHRTLDKCSPDVRTMSPGLVWLLLVPMFNLIWHFFVVTAMARSLDAELTRRQITHEPKPGQSIGMAMCILGCGSIIPFLGILAAIACLVCWIAYWTAIAKYSGQLSTQPSVATAPPVPSQPL
jgi:hypothetical protein